MGFETPRLLRTYLTLLYNKAVPMGFETLLCTLHSVVCQE